MEAQGGYDQDRIISTVPSSLVCGICHQVVRDPRLCEDGEHCFCLSCISHHLNESQTCPVCRKKLCPETLVHPQRCLKRVLRELQIKCDYIERGCSDHIQLGNLQDHVSHCGFAPVPCEKCGMQINRKDKGTHEKIFCQLGAANCKECGNIKANHDEMKQKLSQMKAEMKNDQDEMKASLDNIKQKQNVILTQLSEIMNDQQEYLRSVNESLNELKRSHDQMEGNLNKIEKAQAEIKADQVRFESVVRNFLGVTTQQVQGESMKNNDTQAADAENDQAIIVVGGRCGERNERVFNTVEKYNMVTGNSTDLPQMIQPRTQLASCVGNDEVIVTGGYDGRDGIDSIEILKINQNPLKWTMLDAKLPVKLSRHAIVLHQNKLYAIGGFDHSENGISKAIYEVSFASLGASKLLATMLQQRRNHGAEIVNEKVFILGGRETGLDRDAINSVEAYDFNTNTSKKCRSLPKAVSKMATVPWKNTIIIIGGKDMDGHTLSDVIQYDTQTEQSSPLPSLRHKRRGCSAVMLDDVIVVLGGCDDEGCLNSVESFKMGDDRWKELRAIKEKRSYATAVVLPGMSNITQ